MAFAGRPFGSDAPPIGPRRSGDHAAHDSSQPRRKNIASATSPASGTAWPWRSATVQAIRNTRSNPRTLSWPRSKYASAWRKAARGSRHGRCRSALPGTSPFSRQPLADHRSAAAARARTHPHRHGRGRLPALDLPEQVGMRHRLDRDPQIDPIEQRPG